MPRPHNRNVDPCHKIVPFETTVEVVKVSAEDNPAEWVYPDDSGDEFALRMLAAELVEHDGALASLLVESAKGDLPTGELVRRLNAWQGTMGGNHQRSTLAEAPKPWLA